jgi:hypothetical protein
MCQIYRISANFSMSGLYSAWMVCARTVELWLLHWYFAHGVSMLSFSRSVRDGEGNHELLAMPLLPKAQETYDNTLCCRGTFNTVALEMVNPATEAVQHCCMWTFWHASHGLSSSTDSTYPCVHVIAIELHLIIEKTIKFTGWWLYTFRHEVNPCLKQALI